MLRAWACSPDSPAPPPPAAPLAGRGGLRRRAPPAGTPPGARRGLRRGGEGGQSGQAEHQGEGRTPPPRHGPKAKKNASGHAAGGERKTRQEDGKAQRKPPGRPLSPGQLRYFSVSILAEGGFPQRNASRTKSCRPSLWGMCLIRYHNTCAAFPDCGLPPARRIGMRGKTLPQPVRVAVGTSRLQRVVGVRRRLAGGDAAAGELSGRRGRGVAPLCRRRFRGRSGRSRPSGKHLCRTGGWRAVPVHLLGRFPR